MIAFLRRRWFWFQVWLGLREPPPPLTPQLIARAALDLLEMQLASGIYPHMRGETFKE